MKLRAKKQVVYSRAYGRMARIESFYRKLERQCARQDREALDWLRSQFSSYAGALAWFRAWEATDAECESFPLPAALQRMTRRSMASKVSDALEGRTESSRGCYTSTAYGWSLFFGEPEPEGAE